jgi:hypothetical protein
VPRLGDPAGSPALWLTVWGTASGIGDRTVVQIDVATCLAWNGYSNQAAPMAITAAQALQIAANPAWGAEQMDAALVRDAASQFAGVPGGS